MKSLFLVLWLLAAACLPAQTTQPPEMIFVEGGTFTMGCTPEQQPCYEGSPRVVRLGSFLIGKYEVTLAQWKTVLPLYVSPLNWDQNGLFGAPKRAVSFYDCLTFCNKLSLAEGLTPYYYTDAQFSMSFDSLTTDSTTYLPVFIKTDANGFRLPTEAEWEYAARGGISSQLFRFSGSNVIENVAWYDDNPDPAVFNQPHAIGLKMPNELGLFDMTGNVREIIQDRYAWYAASPDCVFRYTVERGGGTYYNEVDNQIARRASNWPGLRVSWNNYSHGQGLRLARNTD